MAGIRVEDVDIAVALMALAIGHVDRGFTMADEECLGQFVNDAWAQWRIVDALFHGLLIVERQLGGPRDGELLWRIATKSERTYLGMIRQRIASGELAEEER